MPPARPRHGAGPAPFFFSDQAPAPDAGTAVGFRPFYARITGGGKVQTDILFPLYLYRKYPDHYKWTILELINGEGVDSSVTRAGGPKDKHFDIWPFYFSHETDDPVDTYHALFPIVGTMKYRLGFDRLPPGCCFPSTFGRPRRGDDDDLCALAHPALRQG